MFPAFLNAGINLSFRFLHDWSAVKTKVTYSVDRFCLTDLSIGYHIFVLAADPSDYGMTNNISFPSNGNYIVKIRIKK